MGGTRGGGSKIGQDGLFFFCDAVRSVTKDMLNGVRPTFWLEGRKTGTSCMADERCNHRPIGPEKINPRLPRIPRAQFWPQGKALTMNRHERFH